MSTKHLVALSDDEQERLRDALQTAGEDELAEDLGISRVALLRAASGLPMMRGSRSILVAGLKDREEPDDDEDEDEEDDEDEDEETDR